MVKPISIATAFGDFEFEVLEACACRSSAKVTIIAILWTKLAGLGALSALCVLKRRSKRRGVGSEVVEMAVEARAR